MAGSTLPPETLAEKAENAPQPTTHEKGWVKTRIRRHFKETVRIATPAVLTRISIMTMVMVDVAMVGHYSTTHLAWLNLANQSLFMIAHYLGLGLMMGTLIYTARAYGHNDYKECGAVWRRALGFCITISTLLALLLIPSPYWLRLLGQNPEMADHAGHIARIYAIGIPAHLLFVHANMFFEGIQRMKTGLVLMIIANIINLASNYILIYGAFGAPELGGAGSAWTSSIVRWFLAIAIMGYMATTPSLKKYQLFAPIQASWKSWKAQRHMGYASSLSIITELIAFAAIVIFAGWLGAIPTAAYGVLFQILGTPLMIAIGIGVAASVRTGIAAARHDHGDILLACLVSFGLNLGFAFLLGAIALIGLSPILKIFTADPAIIALLIPLGLLFTITMVFDGSQMVASAILRGLSETWWPTLIQGIAFIGFMLPVSYYLAFPYGLGFAGLLWGTLVGVVVSLLLLAVRFFIIIKRQ